MECREVRDLLDSFLGQELLVETNHELMRHLDACRECRAELDARRQLRAALRQAFTTSPALQPRPGFRAEALASVRAASQRRRQGWMPAWLAIAASLALLMTAAIVYRSRAGVDAEMRAAVGDHQNCAVKFQLTERPITLAEAAMRFDPFFAQLEHTPPDDVATAAGPLHVLERHSCVFAGHRYAHVVLTFDGHVVSLLVSGGPKPGSMANAKAIAAHSIDRIGGMRATSFELRDHAAYVVSDVEDAQFRRIAGALEAVSSQFAELASNHTPRTGFITPDRGRENK